MLRYDNALRGADGSMSGGDVVGDTRRRSCREHHHPREQKRRARRRRGDGAEFLRETEVYLQQFGRVLEESLNDQRVIAFSHRSGILYFTAGKLTVEELWKPVVVVEKEDEDEDEDEEERGCVRRTSSPGNPTLQ